MTQIEQIKAELQKRLVKYDPDYTDAGQELQEMLAFVDSLPAETASPELEKAAEEFARASMVIADVDRYKGFIAGAEWQKKQFEKNRLAACDAQTKEEYDRETAFVDKIIREQHRTPTFSDAINFGIELERKQNI